MNEFLYVAAGLGIAYFGVLANVLFVHTEARLSAIAVAVLGSAAAMAFAIQSTDPTPDKAIAKCLCVGSVVLCVARALFIDIELENSCNKK